MPKQGKTRSERSLITGFRRLVRDKRTPVADRRWAVMWLLYLEGESTEKPPARYDVKVEENKPAGERIAVVPAGTELTADEQLIRDLLNQGEKDAQE